MYPIYTAYDINTIWTKITHRHNPNPFVLDKTTNFNPIIWTKLKKTQNYSRTIGNNNTYNNY